MVIRLAEMYLIRAEARAQQDKLSLAADDIDAIKTRAGLAPVNRTLSKQGYLQVIENERWKELFVESAHRWFDLKRTGRAITVLKANKGINIDENDLLYPLPTSAILTNPSLVQNPGYN